MTSPFPPRKRDTRSVADRVRQDRQNLKNLAVGYVGGRFPLVRPLGSAAAAGEFEDDGIEETITAINTDRVVASGPGNLRFPLSFTPIPASSVQIFWEGLPQPPTEWSLDEETNVVTIPDPLGWIAAGHLFTAYYLTVDEASEGIDWASEGPMLIVAEGSTTDYSSPTFDDSGWVQTAGPAGHPLGANVAQPTWPPVVYDTATTNAGVWLRRTITVLGQAALNISVRNDGQWWVYCDGALVASEGTGSPTLGEKGPYPVTVDAGTHVIALHVNDDVADPGSDYLYADLNVEVV